MAQTWWDLPEDAIRVMLALRRTQCTFLLHLAAFVVALVAIVTMPVCFDASNAPILDGDVLTVTESRDVVQVMHQPGTYLLHVQNGVEDHCVTCGPRSQTPSGPLAATVAEVAQRVATLPAALTVHTAVPQAVSGAHQAIVSSLTPAPLSPPPRAIS